MIENKEFKIILNKLLEKELEELRKRFRPYKRRAFLRNKVTIDLDLKYDRKGVLAYYENTRTNEKEWKYEHKIYVTELSRDYYDISMNFSKREGIRELRETIRHELIHAFVFEDFEEWETIENCHGDYSPIFLSCLHWSGLKSPYPYTYKFKESDLYKNIEMCTSYDMVYMHLIRYINDLELTTRKINEKINSNMINYKKLKISFNKYEAGIVKRSYVSCIVKSKKDNNIYIQKASELILGIGFLVTPKDIIENYEKKFDNGSMAIFHSEVTSYMIDNEFKQKAVIR